MTSSENQRHTLVDLYLERIESGGDQPAITHFVDEARQTLTWNELAADVRRLAVGLASLGVKPGDRIAQLSENRYEWIVTDLASHVAQAVHVPIHSTLAPEQIVYQVQHSHAKVLLVSNATQLHKLQMVADQLPAELPLILYDDGEGTWPARTRFVWDSWCQQFSDDDGRQLETRARNQLRGDRLATILYTSGTTGHPKGVMLSQSNLVSNCTMVTESLPISPDDLRLTFLPLSHIFARTCDLYTWLCGGAQLALARARDTVIDDCQIYQPTVINGVPYFYGRLHRVLEQQGALDQPGSLATILGGKIRICCSGGAALPDFLFDFFQQQRVMILQGYGLTETSPVTTISTPSQVRRGTAGVALAGVELKIADDGEILTRGPHIMMGYWNNQAATEEVLRDGWLYTGDLGEIDDDGFLSITGRKKELIITESGKNISPINLESLLTEDPLIEQAMVVGDGRSFLVALIVPDWAELLDHLSAEFRAHSRAELCQLPEVRQRFAEILRCRLACVSYHEQVRRFSLIDRPFTIDAGEVTPKMSLRRGVIAEHYASEIESLYAKPE